jgi:hypothetical protein
VSALPERIGSRIAVDDAGCWLWLGALNSKGYGSAGVNGKVVSVHRLAYELTHGEIPTGHDIHHRCGVRRCCNPEHLEAVTRREHVHEHRPPGAPCARGHERRQKPDGRWYCPTRERRRLLAGWRWAWLRKRGQRFKRVLRPPRAS